MMDVPLRVASFLLIDDRKYVTGPFEIVGPSFPICN